jgi:hypothetical protein
VSAGDSAAQSPMVFVSNVPVVDLSSHKSRVNEREEREGEETEGVEAARDLVRLEGTRGQNVVPFVPMTSSPNVIRLEDGSGRKKGIKSRAVYTGIPGIKKKRGRKGVEEDMPPTPWGCEWLPIDNGWNLWRCWTGRDGSTGSKVKMCRYAGSLSREGWKVMKEYDYEAFISIIGKRYRRYGQR